MPPPYQPITGERETLRAEGVSPYCAMMQVAAEDGLEYVMCRGYDTRLKRFIDYDANDLANKPGIAVAKPYEKRGQAGHYSIGQIIPAFLPLWQIGQNPGTVAVGEASQCMGQPLSADTEIAHQTDANVKYTNWMLIDSGPALMWFKLEENLVLCGEALAVRIETDVSGRWCDGDDETYVADPFGVVAGSVLEGGNGYIPANSNVLAMKVSRAASGDDGPGTYGCAWAAITFGSRCCGGY